MKKKFGVLAVLDIEKLEIKKPLYEEQIILDDIIYAKNFDDAKIKFLSLLESHPILQNYGLNWKSYTFIFHQFRLFGNGSAFYKQLGNRKRNQLVLMKEYNEKCYQAIYENSVAEARNKIPVEFKNTLDNLSLEQLEECYARALANSYLIIRDRAMREISTSYSSTSYFEHRLIVDIGDAFHNYRNPKDELYKYNIIEDLWFYEEWLRTIQVLSEQQYIEFSSLFLTREDFSLIRIIDLHFGCKENLL